MKLIYLNENIPMSILQFESLNLGFVCKRYERNKFGNLKYKIKPKSVII
jgi:hypothetical protein